MPKEKETKKGYLKRKRNFNLDFFIWWLVTALWMVAIYIGSDIEGSANHSWNLMVFIQRKGYHLLEYFILVYLIWKSIKDLQISKENKLTILFFVSVLFAVFDEFHQTFVFGREGNLRDILIDMLSVLFFILLHKKGLK